MTLLVIAGLFAVGLLVGFTAGLIGIGGGVLIVPFLYFLYGHPTWAGFALPTELEAAVAHATSLFVIMPTAIRGTISYSKAGLIEWRIVVPVAIASMVGAVLGANLAILMSAEVLKLMFGAFLIASGTQLILRRHHVSDKPISTNVIATSITGLLIGVLSGMMGVGGGILALPLLMYLLHVELRKSAATSLAIVGFAALSGVVTYAVGGAGVPGRAPGSFGYIHLAAAIPLLVGSLISVHWGTQVNQRTNVKALRYIFASVFILLGAKYVLENAAKVL